MTRFLVRFVWPPSYYNGIVVLTPTANMRCVVRSLYRELRREFGQSRETSRDIMIGAVEDIFVDVDEKIRRVLR